MCPPWAGKNGQTERDGEEEERWKGGNFTTAPGKDLGESETVRQSLREGMKREKVRVNKLR